MLKSDLDSSRRFVFFVRALFSVFWHLPVTNMPDNLPEEIYVCAPIWAGGIAAPAQHFLKNAPLKKVNLLLTCSIISEQYRINGEKFLATLDCIPGKVYLFATGKTPDMEIIEEHVRAIMFNEAADAV